MDATRWQTVQKLFHDALARPSSERTAFLDAVGEDPALIADVRALLDADAGGESALDDGVAEVAERLFRIPDMLPSEIGPYRITGVLGEGGMGVVYLGERDDLGSRVAIKVLRDAALSPARRDRFQREERILASLRHSAVARIYDADVLPDGTPYFVMEAVNGKPITDYVFQKQLSVPSRIRLFRAVCEAVAYAHRQAIVHRDLKPSNIFVEESDQGQPRVKLLDFGIATTLDIDPDRAGTIPLMTPAYAAPEQLRNEPIGVYTDVYSLGVLLYELLAERQPYSLTGRSPGEVEQQILGADPAPPSAHASARLTRQDWADLDILCSTALQKDPSRRYASVEALIRDVDHYLAGEPIEARPDSVRYRVSKFVRRHRGPVTLAVGVAVGLVALTAFYALNLAAARDAALAEAVRTRTVQQFTLGLFEGDTAAGPADSLRVVTLLRQGVREARTLDGEPDLQAELFETLGGLFRQLGDFAQADTLLRASLSLRQATLGPDHPVVARSLLTLGRLRADQAEYDEAERLTREGVAMTRRTLPSGHPQVAEALKDLGVVLTERGEYASAVELLAEAVRLAARQEAMSVSHSDALTALFEAHFYDGDYVTADSIGQVVLTLDRRLHGEQHPAVADDLVNLGAVRVQEGRYSAAERLYRQAYHIDRAYFGLDHDETASTMMGLGQTLAFLNRFEEALALLQPALVVRERVYGPDHPRTANVLNELGTVAVKQGDLAAAERYYRRMTDVYRAAYDDDHYLIGIGLSNLGSVYRDSGQYDRAESVLREAILRFTSTLSADHLNTGIAQLKLGHVLVLAGRHAEAKPVLTAGYRILRPQMDPGSQWLSEAREDLITVYDALGETTRARRLRAEQSKVMES